MNSDQQAEEVQARIAELRESLSLDAHEVTQGAKAMADWRYYPRRFPWATLALTAAAGYLVVPSRTKRASPASQNGIESSNGRHKLDEAKQKSGIVGSLVGALTPMVAAGLMRVGSAYVGKQLSDITHNRMAPQEVDTHGRANNIY